MIRVVIKSNEGGVDLVGSAGNFFGFGFGSFHPCLSHHLFYLFTRKVRMKSYKSELCSHYEESSDSR